MKLPGRYKGGRKRAEQKFSIQCPGGCRWQSKPARFEDAEKEYAQHLLDVHYGILHCAFCPAMLPDWKTLSEHVRDEGHALKKTPLRNGLETHTEI
jgi:hypothetical protein